MPELTPEAYARVSRIIDELADVLDDLDDVPKNFVSDQIERKRQYGERMFMSPKQVAWLERLHEEHVGDTDHKAENPRDLKDDMDDEIPF